MRVPEPSALMAAKLSKKYLTTEITELTEAAFGHKFWLSPRQSAGLSHALSLMRKQRISDILNCGVRRLCELCDLCGKKKNCLNLTALARTHLIIKHLLIFSGSGQFTKMQSRDNLSGKNFLFFY